MLIHEMTDSAGRVRRVTEDCSITSAWAIELSPLEALVLGCTWCPLPLTNAATLDAVTAFVAAVVR